MSCSLFVFALVVALATAIVSAVMDNCHFNKGIVPVVCIGSILVLVSVGLSMRYYNMKHMAICLAYDHVVVVDWNLKADCPVDIDKHKIVHVEDYAIGYLPYRMVIMAWNDPAIDDEYSQLTKER